jgi:hypothetical protein
VLGLDTHQFQNIVLVHFGEVIEIHRYSPLLSRLWSCLTLRHVPSGTGIEVLATSRGAKENRGALIVDGRHRVGATQSAPTNGIDVGRKRNFVAVIEGDAAIIQGIHDRRHCRMMIIAGHVSRNDHVASWSALTVL